MEDLLKFDEVSVKKYKQNTELGLEKKPAVKQLKVNTRQKSICF